jgi:hypothetical protein
MNAVLTDQADGALRLPEFVQLWAWTMAVALLGTWTCFAKLTGVNWPLWTAAAAVGFVVMGRRAGPGRPGAYSYAALALAVIVAGAAPVTANPYSVGMILVCVIALCSFTVLTISWRADAIGPLVLACGPLVACFQVLARARRGILESWMFARTPAARPLLRGGAMAMALAAALLLLLSAANPILADWRDEAWRSLTEASFQSEGFFLGLATLLLGAYGLAAGGTVARGPTAAELDAATGVAPASVTRFSDLERLMVFGTAMALFVLFFSLELASRFGLQGHHLAKGETLAEATHRGFGEMIVAAALCALVIITLDQRALRGARESLVRALAWGVIASSLLAVASAYERVQFYEASYGYTEQRLYVQVCCAAVAMALLLLAWELRASIVVPRLMRRVALVGVLCVGGLAYWNSVAWIVHANVERYQRTGKLDASYLAELARFSPDAVPELLASLPRLAPQDALDLRTALRAAPLGSDGELSWYEWNLRRALARSALCAAGLLDESAVKTECPYTTGPAAAVTSASASGSGSDIARDARPVAEHPDERSNQ